MPGGLKNKRQIFEKWDALFANEEKNKITKNKTQRFRAWEEMFADVKYSTQSNKIKSQKTDILAKFEEFIGLAAEKIKTGRKAAAHNFEIWDKMFGDVKIKTTHEKKRITTINIFNRWDKLIAKTEDYAPTNYIGSVKMRATHAQKITMFQKWTDMIENEEVISINGMKTDRNKYSRKFERWEDILG